jgi:phage head maturation protease
MSFGFRVASSGERWNSARTQRTLNDVELIEISIISGGFPAYDGTTVSARSGGGLVAQSALARRAVALKLRGLQ